MKYGILSAPPKDIAARTRWYVLVRWFVLLAIGVPGILSQYVDLGWSSQLRVDIGLLLVALATNAIFFVLVHRKGQDSTYYYRAVAATLLVVDLLLISYLIFSKGGIESRSVILYVLPMLMSAAIFGRRVAYLVSILSVGLYDFLIIGDYYGVVNSFGAYNPELKKHGAYVLETVVFFSAILLIIGIVGDYIVRLLADKESQALQNLEGLRRAQAIAHLGSWEWNAEANRVIWSEELYRLLGVEQGSEPAGYDGYLMYVHPDDRKYVSETIDRALKRAKHFSFHHRTNVIGKPIRHMQCEGYISRDKSGKIVRVVGTVLDTTQSRLLDEAKSEFVALASHQLRTPATGVKQYLGMLQEGYAGELTEAQRSLVVGAYESNERQLAIIDDLLRVAQIDSDGTKLKRSRTELIGLISGIIATQEHLLVGSGKRIQLVTTQKAIYYPVDAQRFRMAIENLVDNARKYTPEGKNITVRIAKRKNQVLVSVKDEGVGIAPEDISRLFGKFSRIDNPLSVKVGGNGLGLYWANKVVTMHGGKIEVVSRPGVGSEFKILLPLRTK